MFEAPERKGETITIEPAFALERLGTACRRPPRPRARSRKQEKAARRPKRS